MLASYPEVEQAWRDWNRRGLDPLSTVIRGGVFCEKMAGALCGRLVGREAARELSQFDRLKLLEKRGLANPSEMRILHRIRQARNQAAHEGTCTEKECEEIRKERETLLSWFCRANEKLSGGTKKRRFSKPGLWKAAAVVFLLAAILFIALLGSKGVFSNHEEGRRSLGSACLSFERNTGGWQSGPWGGETIMRDGAGQTAFSLSDTQFLSVFPTIQGL